MWPSPDEDRPGYWSREGSYVALHHHQLLLLLEGPATIGERSAAIGRRCGDAAGVGCGSAGAEAATGTSLQMTGRIVNWRKKKKKKKKRICSQFYRMATDKKTLNL